MARKEKEPTVHQKPTESNEKAFIVRLTLREMQCIANACSGFLNVMTKERRSVSVEQTAALISSMEKFSKAQKDGVDIQIVRPL